MLPHFVLRYARGTEAARMPAATHGGPAGLVCGDLYISSHGPLSLIFALFNQSLVAVLPVCPGPSRVMLADETPVVVF